MSLHEKFWEHEDTVLDYMFDVIIKKLKVVSLLNLIKFACSQIEVKVDKTSCPLCKCLTCQTFVKMIGV